MNFEYDNDYEERIRQLALCIISCLNYCCMLKGEYRGDSAVWREDALDILKQYAPRQYVEISNDDLFGILEEIERERGKNS